MTGKSQEAEPATTHVVSCFHCKALFDAVAADACGCLASRGSFLCPGCGRCFCKAPQSYKQGFWERAPETLWQRHTADQRLAPDFPENPGPIGIRRPVVLVVDDELDVRRMAYAALTNLGYTTVLASDGEQGLAIARRYRPELILTDAFMPKLDGRRMCQILKSDPETATAKVVVMTSLYTAARYKYEAMKDFGADDYLPKPLELSALRTLLQKHLGAPANTAAVR